MISQIKLTNTQSTSIAEPLFSSGSLSGQSASSSSERVTPPRKIMTSNEPWTATAENALIETLKKYPAHKYPGSFIHMGVKCDHIDMVASAIFYQTGKAFKRQIVTARVQCHTQYLSSPITVKSNSSTNNLVIAEAAKLKKLEAKLKVVSAKASKRSAEQTGFFEFGKPNKRARSPSKITNVFNNAANVSYQMSLIATQLSFQAKPEPTADTLEKHAGETDPEKIFEHGYFTIKAKVKGVPNKESTVAVSIAHVRLNKAPYSTDVPQLFSLYQVTSTGDYKVETVIKHKSKTIARHNQKYSTIEHEDNCVRHLIKPENNYANMQISNFCANLQSDKKQSEKERSQHIKQFMVIQRLYRVVDGVKEGTCSFEMQMKFKPAHPEADQMFDEFIASE